MAPFGILNLAVVASTLTSGFHYGADVAAGLVIGLLTVTATRPVGGKPQATSIKFQTSLKSSLRKK
jgi:membrane-associated phospholipid phosphatase